MAVQEEIGIIQGINLKKARGGKVKRRYEVQLESGRQVLVNEQLISPILSKQLPNGARLKVTHQDGVVHRASVYSLPPRVVRVAKCDQRKGRIVVAEEDGSTLTLRLSADSKIWASIDQGIKLQVAPRVEADGKAKYTLEVVSEPVPTPSPTPPSSVTHLSGESRKRPSAAPSDQPSIPVRMRVGTGSVVHVYAHHLTVTLDEGGKVNCLLSQWPGDVVAPQMGTRLKCRYAQDKYAIAEILEILDAGLPSEEQIQDRGAAEVIAEVGFDPAYFAERQREGHRYEIMAFLKEHGEQGHIEWYRMCSAVAARYVNPQSPLRHEVYQAISRDTPGFRFYLHQAQALNAIRVGRNVLLVTQTASGKTLAYNPAIFEAFCSSDDNVHALYVFPLNALMMDQKQKIDNLCKQLGARGFGIDAGVLQGGIGRDRRLRIATRNPQVVCTNPEMLSVMLGDFQGGHWHQFFGGLRYVVLDEVHSYRGLLGIHAAGLIRRLLLTTHHCGVEPQFILSSATVRNPLDLATRLTSLPASRFTLLDKKSDGSAQEVKHWAIYSPDAGASGDNYGGYLDAAASAMVDLLCARDSRGRPSPLNTILFAKSMRDVNKAYQIVVRNLEKRCPGLVGKVREFISARLTLSEKRDIYEGLRNGRYVGVVSTNALEAGIDIGRLDACIIAGFPFTVMRMRQMAGRVGRRDEGLVLFVPHPASPVDEYYRYDPGLLLTQKPEVFVVDAENPYIMRKHLNAAALHLNGISMNEASIFGSHLNEMLERAAEDRVMRRVNDRLFGTRRNYKNLKDVYAIHNIRSNVQCNYAVCLDDGVACQITSACLSPPVREQNRCPRRISLMDRQYVYRDCHPGAIYEAGDRGRFYRIVSIDERNRVVRARQLPDDTLERTFVDETTTIEIIGSARGSKALPGGVRMAWGKVRVTRSFDGYYSYTLIPARRCRRCRKEFDETADVCPTCGRPTETFFRHPKPEHQEFPPPYNERGFSLPLETVAAWMVIPAEIEERLYDASPCKLPGDKNRVMAFLRKPLDLSRLPGRLGLTEDEAQVLHSYYEKAGKALRRRRGSPRETILYPGVYGQCLLRVLRQEMPEARALEIFAAVTGYPVTDELRHVCRKCQTSVLLPAMHTVEHTVVMRYPSVALGHQSDLGSYTTLGHPITGGPTIFWFDNYEGGIGAAEKVFDQINDLLEASWTTIHNCNCTTIEGCPYCTQIAQCGRRNEALSKPAAARLIHLLLDREMLSDFAPFVYRARRRKEFNGIYTENEYAGQEHGIGSEAPDLAASTALNPHDLLRIQRLVHDPVLHKAFEVRSTEITNEVPPVSAAELQTAYWQVLQDLRPSDWHLAPDMTPYQVLEVQPIATSRMVSRIYRVIARELHPDANPGRQKWANQMMRIVNNAYDEIRKERSTQSQHPQRC